MIKIKKSSEVSFFSDLDPHSKANIKVFAQAQVLYELKEEKKRNPEFRNDLSKVWSITSLIAIIKVASTWEIFKS